MIDGTSGERHCHRETQVQLSLHQCISIEVHCIVLQTQFSSQFLYIINHKLIKRENMVMLTWKTFTVGFKPRTMHNLLLKSAFSIGKQQQPTFNPNKLAWRVWKPSTVFLDRKRTKAYVTSCSRSMRTPLFPLFFRPRFSSSTFSSSTFNWESLLPPIVISRSAMLDLTRVNNSSGNCRTLWQTSSDWLHNIDQSKNWI